MKLLNIFLAALICLFFVACEGTKNKQTDTTQDTTTSSGKDQASTKTTEGIDQIKALLVAQKWMYNTDAVLAMNFSKEELEKMPEERKKAMIEAAKTWSMEFTPEGNYTENRPGGKQVKGTWTLGKDNKTLYTQAQGESVKDSVVIKELTTEKMVVEGPGDRKKRITMVMKPATMNTVEKTDGSTTTKK